MGLSQKDFPNGERHAPPFSTAPNSSPVKSSIANRNCAMYSVRFWNTGDSFCWVRGGWQNRNFARRYRGGGAGWCRRHPAGCGGVSRSRWIGAGDCDRISAEAEKRCGQNGREDSALLLSAARAAHPQIRAARRRSALPITDTELKLMAAAAMMGLNSSPNAGYSTPAATGIPMTL